MNGPTGGPRSFRQEERGGALPLVLLFLPLLTTMFFATIDLAQYYRIAGHYHAVADLASLSGVQELDLQELAEGRRVFTPSAAGEARRIARLNLEEFFARAEQERVDVYVIQTEGRSGTARHPVSGRRVRDPTVGVRIRASYRPQAVLRLFVRSLPIDVLADASVFPRRRW